jgi:hypothetical protein
MNWIGFASAHWKWVALAGLLFFIKRSCGEAERAYKWEQAYEAQQEVYKSTARQVVVTNQQLRNENRELLDSLKIRPRSVEFVYKTRWRTVTDTFPVIVYREWYDTVQVCPAYSLTIDTLCTRTEVRLHPDSSTAKVRVESYGDMSVVGYWKRPGKWFGGKLWNAIRGRKESYIQITSSCFHDTSVSLNEFKRLEQ